MKKSIPLFLLLTFILLSGCSEFKEENQRYNNFIEGEVTILVDAENGCQYVTTGDVESGIYPRMNIDGNQICEKGE